MHTLLTIGSDLSRGAMVNMTTYRLLHQHEVSIDRLRVYYANDYVAVDSTNPFIRLLYTLSSSSSYMQTYNMARNKESELCAVGGIYNDINSGVIYKNKFYKDTPCVLVDCTWYTTAALMAVDDWMTIQPCRVLVHPGTSYSLSRPDLSHAKGDYAVIGVDIPALGFMYGKWLEFNSALPPEQQDRPEGFLAKFLLPNMLYSQMDAIMADSFNESPTPLHLSNLQITPMQVVDVTSQLLQSVSQTLALLPPSTAFSKALDSIPSLTLYQKGRLSNVLSGMRSRLTIKNRWVDVAVYLPVVLDLAQRYSTTVEYGILANEYAMVRRTLRLENTLANISDYQIKAILNAKLHLLDDHFKIAYA